TPAPLATEEGHADWAAAISRSAERISGLHAACSAVHTGPTPATIANVTAALTSDAMIPPSVTMHPLEHLVTSWCRSVASKGTFFGPRRRGPTTLRRRGSCP